MILRETKESWSVINFNANTCTAIYILKNAFMPVVGWQFGASGTENPFSEKEVAL